MAHNLHHKTEHLGNEVSTHFIFRLSNIYCVETCTCSCDMKYVNSFYNLHVCTFPIRLSVLRFTVGQHEDIAKITDLAETLPNECL